MPKISSTSIGARPSEGSSSRMTFGRDISARPIASICCSPPDRYPAGCERRFFKHGKVAVNALDPGAHVGRVAFEMWPPAMRFSSAVRCSNTRRPSNTWEMPRLVTSYARHAVDALAVQRDVAFGDLAALGAQHAGNRLQRRGLARAVATEQRRDAARLRLERYAPQHQNDAVVDDLDVVDREHARCPRMVRMADSESRLGSRPLLSATRHFALVRSDEVLVDHVAIGAEPVAVLDELAALDRETCTQPPPSWSAGGDLHRRHHARPA